MPKAKKKLYVVTGVAEFYTVVSAPDEGTAQAMAADRGLQQGCAPDPRLAWRYGGRPPEIQRCLDMLPPTQQPAPVCEPAKSRTEKPTRTRVGATKPKQEEAVQGGTTP